MTSMRTTLLLASLLAVLAAGFRKREPSKVEIFDETATPAQTEALGSLAPLWPAPERDVLDNGLLVHWLHEDDTPALHLRLILPTHGLKAARQGAPALTVARDLAAIGYRVQVFDDGAKLGGMIRTQIPKFRLPEEVIDEETGYVLNLGVEFRSGQYVASLRDLLAEGYDAVFIGSGAPRGQDLDVPGQTWPSGSGRAARAGSH